MRKGNGRVPAIDRPGDATLVAQGPVIVEFAGWHRKGEIDNSEDNSSREGRENFGPRRRGKGVVMVVNKGFCLQSYRNDIMEMGWCWVLATSGPDPTQGTLHRLIPLCSGGGGHAAGPGGFAGKQDPCTGGRPSEQPSATTCQALQLQTKGEQTRGYRSAKAMPRSKGITAAEAGRAIRSNYFIRRWNEVVRGAPRRDADTEDVKKQVEVCIQGCPWGCFTPGWWLCSVKLGAGVSAFSFSICPCASTSHSGNCSR